MDDYNSVFIREFGVDVIGEKLLVTSKQNFSNFCSGVEDEKDAKLRVELLSLICLWFLYSVEKNWKAFWLVFPPEIFGPFIDISNYEKNWDRYDSTLQKIEALEEAEKNQILENFKEMWNISVWQGDASKVINGYTIIDIAGKGAFG